MPGKTTIEWATHTWNPVTGCTKVSAGCDHCYAEQFAERWRGVEGHPYEQGFDLRLWERRIELPLVWTKPRSIFVNSMSDLWHADVPQEFIERIFAVMALATHHTFMILTKRPRRMHQLTNNLLFWARVEGQAQKLWEERNGGNASDLWIGGPDRPLPNVWLGVSVEDQDAAFRIDYLAETPAAIRFLSCEPLLGPIDLTRWIGAGPISAQEQALFRDLFPDGLPANSANARIGAAQEAFRRNLWVIAGGESGPGARRMDPGWATGIRDQCAAGDVPFFFKQTGTVLAREWGLRSPKGGNPAEWPDEVSVRQFPEVPA